VQGLTVSSLSQTSGTSRNGLRNGDVIVRVNGEDVHTMSPSTVLSKLRTSDSSEFIVELLPSVEESVDSSVTMVSFSSIKFYKEVSVIQSKYLLTWCIFFFSKLSELRSTCMPERVDRVFRSDVTCSLQYATDRPNILVSQFRQKAK